MLKAYRLNDYEAWAWESLEDAISVAMKECGTSKEETFDDCYGYEIPGDTEIQTEDDGMTNVYSMLAVMEATGEKGLVVVFGDP